MFQSVHLSTKPYNSIDTLHHKRDTKGNLGAPYDAKDNPPRTGR